MPPAFHSPGWGSSQKLSLKHPERLHYGPTRVQAYDTGAEAFDQVDEMAIQADRVADHPVDPLQTLSVYPLGAPGLDEMEKSHESLVLAEVDHTWQLGKQCVCVRERGRDHSNLNLFLFATVAN